MDAAFKIGDWVRVNLKGGCRHHSPARIVAIMGDKLAVQPPKHKRTEIVDAAICKSWKSKNMNRKEQLNECTNNMP